jgi:hypothetical protein
MLRLGWSSFLDVRLNSFLSGWDGRFWFGGTFGRYLLAMAGLAFLLVLVHAFACFMIAKHSRQYLSMLLALVPWTALYAAFLYFLLNMPFAFESADLNLGSASGVPYLEVWVSVAAAAAALLLAQLTLKRNRTADL